MRISMAIILMISQQLRANYSNIIGPVRLNFCDRFTQIFITQLSHR